MSGLLDPAGGKFLGVQAPGAPDSLGPVRSFAAEPLYQVAWWYLLFPSLALLITTLAFNIFGDGVRDAFDPRSDRLFGN